MQDSPAPSSGRCSALGCDAKLNRDNASGRCPRHRYIPVADRAICAADGCGQPLRKDNRTGYCTPHRRFKGRGEVPERNYSGRVYPDRACADCGDAFTPASASQQRCAGCRPERKRALKRKQDWDICSVEGCGAKLRASNTTGRWREHRYIPAAPSGECGAAECSKPLRSDNTTGFCEAHKTAKSREPARCCAAPNCDRAIRTDNTTGYCSDHAEPYWRTPEYLAKRRADYATQPKAPDRRRKCSVDGCGRKIRSDNALGRCSDHRYLPMDWGTCSVEGCSARIKPDNRLGRCLEHRGLYWAGDAPKCGEPGCGKTLYRDNQTGFCHEHRKAYRDAYNRDYYDRNQVALREYSRQYREVHAGEHRAAVSAWNAANRAVRIASDTRRRLAAAARMDDTDRLLSICYRLAIRNDPCFYCGSPVTAHTDHFFPLAKGGSDHWWNLVRACQPCNNAKYAMCGTAFILLTGG